MTRKIFSNIAIAFFGICLAVGFLGVLVRILPQNLTRIDYGLTGEERIFSASRGFKFRPNFSRVWTGLGPPTIWHFNNLGFRDRPVMIAKPANIFRVVVIGDSITMGFGVEDYEAFPRRLEQYLKPSQVGSQMTHIEVVNLGIQGYSTPQYLAVLKEEALRLNPDLVIIALYPSNDIGEAIGFKANRLHNFLAAIPDYLPMGMNQFLKTNSRLYLFFLTKYYSFISRYSVSLSSEKVVAEEDWALLTADLQEIKRLTEESKVRLLTVVLPRPKEVVKFESYEDGNKLINVLKGLGIVCYGPLADLRKYSRPAALYLDILDDHFSPAGNDFFALSLAKFLWGNGLVPKNK